MRTLVARLALGAAIGLALCCPSAQALSTGSPPPIGEPSCAASQLSATYTMVFGSNATGHVEYTLTVTNHSGSRSCALAAPLDLTLLGERGQSLPTNASFHPSGAYRVVLAHGQWAQAVSQLSPDLAGPGEPMRGNCEPTARALRITIGGSSLRAPMDPTPVCQKGAIFFERLKAIAPSPRCTASSLRASFKRDFPPFAGLVPYSLTLRNTLGRTCHADSIVGLRLLGSGGRRLATRVRSGISSPYVFPAHALETAAAMLSTKHGGCDPIATRLAVSPSRGAGTLSTPIRPPLRVCQSGLIELSSLFVNG